MSPPTTTDNTSDELTQDRELLLSFDPELYARLERVAKASGSPLARFAARILADEVSYLERRASEERHEDDPTPILQALDFEHGTRAAHPLGTHDKEPLLVPAYRLIEAFEQNGLRARREWSGKLVQVSGRIHSIGGMFAPKVSLRVENDEGRFEGLLYRDVSDIEAVMSLNMDDAVNAVGRVDDLFDRARLTDCRFACCEPPEPVEVFDGDQPDAEDVLELHDAPPCSTTTVRWITGVGMVVITLLVCFTMGSDWRYSGSTDAPGVPARMLPHLIENYAARELREIRQRSAREIAKSHMAKTECEVREPERDGL